MIGRPAATPFSTSVVAVPLGARLFGGGQGQAGIGGGDVGASPGGLGLEDAEGAAESANLFAGQDFRQHPEGDAEQCAAPDEVKQQHGLRRRQCEHRDRGVRAGDQQEDVGVVDALEDELRARLPVDAVIERRVAEQEQ